MEFIHTHTNVHLQKCVKPALQRNRQIWSGAFKGGSLKTQELLLNLSNTRDVTAMREYLMEHHWSPRLLGILHSSGTYSSLERSKIM